ncbi:MAG: hypothetical protein AAGC65_14855, partial [Mucilaginibacter sp.]|uniref:hypothetical protein n=1 Tax=Mucilaginibacter sp. TaxID=1882438 RepID=UPI0031AF8CE3
IHIFILCLSAMFFAGKSFLGFSVYHQLSETSANNVLVKVFAKRKPEFLEEAAERSVSILNLLRDKADDFLLTFHALLLAYVGLLRYLWLAGRHDMPKNVLPLLQPKPIYLTSCKLII